MSSVVSIVDALIIDEGTLDEPSDRNSDGIAIWIESLYRQLPLEDKSTCISSLCKTYRSRVQPLVHSIVQGDFKDDAGESAMFRLTYLNSFLLLFIEKNESTANGSRTFTSSEIVRELFADVLFPVLEDVMKVCSCESSPLLTKLLLFLLRWIELTLTHHVRPDDMLSHTLRSWTCRLLATTCALSNDDDENEIPFFSSLDPTLYFGTSIKETLLQPLSSDLSVLVIETVRHLRTPYLARHSWSLTPFVPIWQKLHALVVQVTASEEEEGKEIDDCGSLSSLQQKVMELLDHGYERPMTKAMIHWVSPPPVPPPSPASSLHLGCLRSRSTIAPSQEREMAEENFSPEQQRHAICYYFALSTVTTTAFETHWVPLIFSWLQSSRDAEMHTAVLIMDRCLQKSNVDIDEVVWSNLCTILQRLRKIHRQGWNLMWLGWLERRIFHFGFSHGILESKRILQAMQEWLLILDRNNRHYTQDHLIYGLLCVVTPFLYDCIHLYTSLGNGIELGRLGLSSLLPILDGSAGYGEIWQYHAADETRDVVSFSFSAIVQLLTLASLSNFLIFSYPILSRHAGKTLCNLLFYIRRLDDCEAHNSGEAPPVLSTPFRKSIRQCAMQVAARALVLLGAAADVVLTRVVQDDQYDVSILDIAASIRLDAQKIAQEVQIW